MSKPELERLGARREQTIDELSSAFADDTLDLAEFEKRLALAHRAADEQALESITRDLPKRTLGPPAFAAAAPAQLTPTVATPPAVHETRGITAVLGAISRTGPWTPPRVLKANAVLGAISLDFREAELAPGVTELQVNATLGSVDIIVPPQLAVQVEGTAVLGAFDHVERVPASPDETRPLLRITGVVCLGAVDVVTRLKKPDEKPRAAKRRA